MKRILLALFLTLPLLTTVQAEEELIWNPKGLAWNHNTESDLAGYFIYETATPGDYQNPIFAISVPAGTNVFDFSVAPRHADGHYFWVLTAYDYAGNESDHSIEVTAAFDFTAPNPPTGCTTYK